jgi:hypothetical protein
MTQRDRDIKVPIGDLLDEYFRLRQTIHLLRESLILPYVAERNNPGIKKKLLVAGSARLRIEVGKLLTGSAIDKKSFVNKISDAFKEQVWDNSTIENLEKTLIARCKAIETEASNVPPSVDKSRVCLAKSWNHSFEDLDGINLFRSSISAEALCRCFR